MATRGTPWIENDLTVKFQLEEGNQATPYEPYIESTQYITAKDEEGNIAELRSSTKWTVKDEVDVTFGGKCKHKESALRQAQFSGTVTNYANMATGGQIRLATQMVKSCVTRELKAIR